MKQRRELKKRDPKERVNDFEEISTIYSDEEAMGEASRCLQCKNPTCVKGCPAGIDIPFFLKLVKEGKFEEALLKIKEQNNLPAVCGRVCPQEEQCELQCVLTKARKKPVAIGNIERFLADKYNSALRKKTKSNGKKAAIVGAGPSGLSCAADLSLLGYDVTIFEALHEPGGVLSYGIPEFRLPKRIVKKEIDYLKKLGVRIRLNSVIGKMFSIDELKEDFDAVYVGNGAGLPYFLGIKGENLQGVYSANEFLTRINLMKSYKFPDYQTPVHKGKKVVVIGGGNVAMDAARCAKRLGSEVVVVYRRSEKEMPARKEEIENAMEEGIIFYMMTNVTEIKGENKVEGVNLIQMMLGADDETGRPKPSPIEGSDFEIECDQVIVAVGQGPNPMIIKSSPGLESGFSGKIKVDDDMRTSIKGVYAGGDVVSGSATVINAIADGKRAAKTIDNDLR